MGHIPDIDSRTFDPLWRELGAPLEFICRDFIVSARYDLDEIGRLLFEDDPSSAATIARRHKGGSLSLGFPRMATIFNSLENQGSPPPRFYLGDLAEARAALVSLEVQLAILFSR